MYTGKYLSPERSGITCIGKSRDYNDYCSYATSVCGRVVFANPRSVNSSGYSDLPVLGNPELVVVVFVILLRTCIPYMYMYNVYVTVYVLYLFMSFICFDL